MRIAIMAAGAVGAYFGARWQVAGHEVHFIARGAHLEAIRKHGLTIESGLGDLHLEDVKVTDDPKSVGPVEFVLFAVKLWDTEKAGEQTKPLVGPKTRVVTVQNGVDSVERLAPILGDDVVIGGSTYIVTTIAAPGTIRHGGKHARILCGRLDGKPDPVLEGYAKELQVPGVEFTVTPHMNADLWKKFVLLSGTSGITASTRRPMGDILADPDMKNLFRTLMAEATAIGRAAGADIPADLADERLRAAAEFPPNMRASMANDLAAGNRLELDWLAGKVVALGRKLGVPTPANETVYAVMKAHRMGRPAD
jgi:2-dehydropantoate 2-reductase